MKRPVHSDRFCTISRMMKSASVLFVSRRNRAFLSTGSSLHADPTAKAGQQKSVVSYFVSGHGGRRPPLIPSLAECREEKARTNAYYLVQKYAFMPDLDCVFNEFMLNNPKNCSSDAA